MWPNKQNYWLYFGHISVEVRGRKQKKQRCLLTSEGPLLATTTSWLCPFHLPKSLSSPNPPFYSTEMPSMASPFSFLSPLLLLRRFRLTSGGNRWSRFWILVESRLAEMVTYPHPRIAFKKDLQLEFRVPNLRFCRHLHSSRVVCLQFHNLISFLLCVFFLLLGSNSSIQFAFLWVVLCPTCVFNLQLLLSDFLLSFETYTVRDVISVKLRMHVPTFTSFSLSLFFFFFFL